MVTVESLKDKLNGLVICISDSWGGLEKVAAQDAIDAAEMGLKVKVLCLEESPIHEHIKKTSSCLEVIAIDFKPRNFLDFKLKRELIQLLEQGTNLVHVHQPSLLGSISPWLWEFPKVALLATRHIMNNHNKKDFIHRALYRRLDALIVMSQALRKNVLETHPIRPRDIKVVNLGLDLELFDPEKTLPEKQRALWGANDETLVIGLVGRIDPAKGQATFIKAAAGLLKNRRANEHLKFVLVGEETLGGDTNHREELKNMVSQFHLEEDVVFSGYHENIPEVMSAFDVFVMPSRQEAFGLVAIEAMAMECPCIISAGGSSAEIVGNEEFGLLVSPDSAFDLQRQIRYLLNHPAERVQMGKRAREQVRLNYDRRTRKMKTLELYEKALKRRQML